MADRVSRETRSRIMRAVPAKGSRHEMRVRKALHAAGFRYRLHSKGLPGRPDIVLAKHKIAVFVHGCFWHGHDCRAGRLPTSNVDFWNDKVQTNKARDARVLAELTVSGWRPVVIWTCQPEESVRKLLQELELLK